MTRRHHALEDDDENEDDFSTSVFSLSEAEGSVGILPGILPAHAQRSATPDGAELPQDVRVQLRLGEANVEALEDRITEQGSVWI